MIPQPDYRWPFGEAQPGRAIVQQAATQLETRAIVAAVRRQLGWVHFKLEFARIRADGHVVTGLRSALNSAIRRGEVERHGADHIARATATLPKGQLSFAGMSPDVEPT